MGWWGLYPRTVCSGRKTNILRYFGRKEQRWHGWTSVGAWERMKNTKMMPSQILSAEHKSLPVSTQPVISLALTKIKNESRDKFLSKIHLFLHFSNGFLPVPGEARVCRDIWMCWEQRSACAQQRGTVCAPIREHLCKFSQALSCPPPAWVEMTFFPPPSCNVYILQLMKKLRKYNCPSYWFCFYVVPFAQMDARRHS